MAYAFTLPGNEPTPPRPALGDHSGATSLAFAIAGALFKRVQTGEPSVVETSLLQTAVWMLSSDVTYSQTPGYKVHSAAGIPYPLMRAYATKDGRLIQLMLLDPRPHWPSLCRMLEIDDLVDDPRFADNASRMRNVNELVAILGERIGRHDWAHWQPIFDAWDAPWELVRTIADIHVDPQVLANDMIFTLEVGGSPIRVVAGPATFDGKATPVDPKGSPGMGEHTTELLSGVGYSADDIADLKTRNVAQ